MKSEKRFLAWLLLLLGAICFTMSSGRWNAPIMAWIWPFCMLYFSRNTKGLLGWLVPAALLCSLSAVKWGGAAGGVMLENILTGAALGFLAAVALLVDRVLYERVGGFKATFIYPLVFVVIEFVMQLTPLATLGPISATQTGNDPMVQIASVFGSYGITFLVVWFSSVLMFVIDVQSRDSRQAMKGIAAFLMVFLVLLFYGETRLALSDIGTKNVKLAMTTGPYLGDFMDDYEYIENLPVEDNIRSLLQSVDTAVAGRADILLFCEEAFCVSDFDEEAMLTAASRAAREKNIFILLPLEVEDTDDSRGGKTENVEYLFDNQGEQVWKYYKSHLTNFIETQTVVKGEPVIPQATVTLPNGTEVKIASVICMDSDFPTFIRDKMDNDVDLLLIPTWDWAEIRAYHTKWVELRAAENGVCLARSCMDGVSTATDPYGRVIMLSDTAGAGYENVIFAEIPARDVFAFYKYIGPVMDWCYVAGLAALIVIGVVKKKSKKTMP